MFNHGNFRHQSNKPGTVKSSGESASSKEEKLPAKSTPTEKGKAPQADVGEKHITETHPGQTQPHPTTGVHAVAVHHKGGGKHTTHTHHEDGTVESKEHNTAAEAHGQVQNGLPSDGMDSGADPMGGGEDYSDVLSGIGGQ
jgi:hypothetical protein